jgi:anti-sigma B factor antagonist
MPPQPHWMEVEMVGDVAVVRFTQRSILGEDAIAAIGQQLFELAESGTASKFVLNFARVESMTTAMMGKLIALQRKVEGSQGRLALCNIGPFLSEIFKILHVPPQMGIYREEQEALQSF